MDLTVCHSAVNSTELFSICETLLGVLYLCIQEKIVFFFFFNFGMFIMVVV